MSATQDVIDLWPLIQDCYRLTFAARRAVIKMPPPSAQLVEEFGIDPANIGHFEYVLSNYDPQALSVQNYAARNSYEHPSLMEAFFANLLESGLVELLTATTYRITAKGHRLYDRLYELIDPRWALPALPDEDIEQLIALLAVASEAIRNAPEPPVHWSVTTRAGHALTPPPATHRRERLHRHTFDLWAYRDDVHLAAWKDHNIAPRTWEAFTILWRGEGDSAQTIAEALKDHGYSAGDYAESLRDLAGRGWLASGGEGMYRITPEGKQVRDDAERLTDEWFYTPILAAMRADELAALRALLIRLRDHYQELAGSAAG